MIVQRRGNNPDSNLNIFIENAPICEVNCITILGIKIDNNLSFNSHTDKIRMKIRKLIPIFFGLRRYMSIDNMMKIYYAYVHSNISYCLQVYSKDIKFTLEVPKNKYLNF